MATKLSCFEVTKHGPNSFALSAKDAVGNRYHAWIDCISLESTDDVLYKNPAVNYGEPGYFNTRKLYLDSSANARALFATMQQAAMSQALVSIAIAKYKREQEEAKRRHEREMDAQRVRACGPELLAALESILAEVDQVYDGGPTVKLSMDVIQKAATAVSQATGGLQIKGASGCSNTVVIS